ncbi:hypothetical protein CEXT_459021 [Caerostris extrusa]|uniref:Uncharacterized protein n=1 Tax=Caerostris extrusa TaxID=172846 RepID=A0AAV4MF46_CAEEX|nr:hypothetical protein CEXT_459021 [Caerostris extrusa]
MYACCGLTNYRVPEHRPTLRCTTKWQGEGLNQAFLTPFVKQSNPTLFPDHLNKSGSLSLSNKGNAGHAERSHLCRR